MRVTHGGDVEGAAQRFDCAPEDVLDLSTGLHPAGPPAWLGGWLCRESRLAGRYPRPDGEPARSALASALGVAPECVVVAAGAQAVIEVVFQALGWRRVAVAQPGYAEPLRCAARAGCSVAGFPPGGAPPPADAVWITDPHNPTGARCPFPADRSGVLDEAYLPLDERRRLGVCERVLRVGSLTKVFCVAGLRLGYAVAEPGRIARLRAWLPPWPADTLALHLLPRLLPEWPARDAAIRAGRTRLAALLERSGFRTAPSQAPFVLAWPDGRPEPDFEAHRILVRHFPEWPSLAGGVRIGIPGSEADWRRLEAALCP